jgi:AraC-like DNA-binding protein
MDISGKHMDKIVRARSRLLSQQVVDARYFFHRPGRGSAPAAALGGRETCRPDFRVHRRRYPYAVLEYVAEGRGAADLAGRHFPLEPGAVFAYPRDTPCEITTDAAQPMVKYFLCFASPAASTALAKAGLAAGTVRVLRSHSGVRSVFEDIIREGQHHGRIAQEIGAVLFQLLLLKLREAGTRHPRRTGAEPGREAFLRCKALIDAETERLGTLQEIAAAAGIESSSVCRLFRRFQGTSPYQYLLRRKMTIAASHLVEHGSLVKEAALRVGFSDPYHFSRCFKAVHGVPPRELLRLRS